MADRLPDEAPAPMVLALSAASRPRATLQRAHALALDAGTRLVVVACLPKALEGNAAAQEERHVALRVWRWCHRTLSIPIEADDVVIRRGRLPTCAATVARQLNAPLVVVSESDVVKGADVTAIVEAAGVSVLVSRATREQDRVIAATDLVRATFPVLRSGAALARSLGAALTVVHNVPPGRGERPGPDSRRSHAWSPLDVPGLDRSSALLAWVVEDLGIAAEARVTQRADTAAAILEIARLQQADLIVVGHRRRSWIVRWLRRGVAERLIDGSRLSVAVIPLHTQEEGPS